MDKQIILDACQKHGAKSVYDAAYQRIAGDNDALTKVGLAAKTIADADKIGRFVFDLMGAVDKSKDLTNITIDLAKLK